MEHKGGNITMIIAGCAELQMTDDGWTLVTVRQ